jgi:hypothetical protein
LSGWSRFSAFSSQPGLASPLATGESPQCSFAKDFLLWSFTIFIAHCFSDSLEYMFVLIYLAFMMNCFCWNNYCVIRNKNCQKIFLNLLEMEIQHFYLKMLGVLSWEESNYPTKQPTN